MARYPGKIGLQGGEQETSPGVWANAGVVELSATGDILSPGRSYQNGEKINSDLEVSDRISIICSRELEKRIGDIRYATLYNTRWMVTSVSFRRPRVELTLGGAWHGDVPN